MELNRAIEKLNKFTNIKNLYGSMIGFTTSQYQEIKESAITVLQHIKHLQKENTMLENTKNNCPHFNTSGISCDKKFCNLDDYISKDKIKDCLDDIEDYFENVSVPYEDIEFIKEKRKDLLKEE